MVENRGPYQYADDEWFMLNSDEQTEQAFSRIVDNYFRETCGDIGRGIFDNHTLLLLRQLYGANLNKLSRKSFEIIEKAGDLKPAEVPHFFQTAISQETIEFAARREQELENIQAAIVKELHLHGQKFASSTSKVVAVFLGGSYSNMTFDEDSDLDCTFFLSGDETHFIDEDGEAQTYEDEFIARIKRSTHKEIDDSSAAIPISPEALKINVSFFKDKQYEIISLDPEISNNIQTAIAQAIQEHS
jgi:hypothetical protein